MIAPSNKKFVSFAEGYTPRDFDHSPMIVFYELTRACDLACLHCRACAQSESDASELSQRESRQVIDQLAQFPRPPMLVLTGGDPLKRPDVYDLVRYGVKAGLSVSVTPSATPLVTFDALQELHAAGISRLGISLDGADADEHDRMRGVSGSFDRTLQIVRDARRIGISVQINTTITPHNRGQIAAMAELLSHHEIVLWSVFFLVPVGRAATGERLSAEGYEQVFAELLHQSHQQSFAIKTTEAPHYRRFLLQQAKQSGESGQHLSRRTPLGINDGKGILFISHAGLLHPSGFMPIVCGAFPHDNIVRVYQNSEILRALRQPDLLEGKCGDCEYRKICGGSRARSFALTGNPLAPEPDCIYQPPESRGTRVQRQEPERSNDECL